MAHYIIFQIWAHPLVSTSSASSLREALRSYALGEFATEQDDGRLAVEMRPSRVTTFSHELEAIECHRKVHSGTYWTVKLVKDDDWMSSIAHVFRGDNPCDHRKYIKLCREQFGEKFDLPRKAFIWQLHEGPLVTFYTQRRHLPIRPEALGKRFIIPWATWPEVREWSGDYEMILEELAV